jgi:hypothetical protein
VNSELINGKTRIHASLSDILISYFLYALTLKYIEKRLQNGQKWAKMPRNIRNR